MEVNASNGAKNWSNYHVSGTSIVYNGAGLTSGAVYSYVVSLQSSSACSNPTSGGGSYVAGSFTYGGGDPTASNSLAVGTSGNGYGSIASSPLGIDCGNTCSASFGSGTSITLMPTPAAGSTFAGWSGDCTGTGACTLSMNAAKNVTAAFSPTGTVYSGTVINTTLNRQATLTLSILVDPRTNAISGSVSVANLPGSSDLLCGAGTISGTRSGTALNFSYTSHDTRAGCGAGVDWGKVINYAASVKDASIVTGTFTDSGTAGQYTLTCAGTNCLPMAANSQSDCLFNWAERSFPQYFSPVGAASENYDQYYYRYFSDTGNYLATSADNYIWLLGPISGNALLKLAPISDYLGSSGCPQ